MTLTFLDASCKWNRGVFVFLEMPFDQKAGFEHFCQAMVRRDWG